MKAKLAILVLLSSAPWVAAQSTVPKLMSYQGRVTDSAGVAIGSTAAVNRTVTFRLYSVPSGGTASYNETQTVTISGGEFSVLIGNGTGLTGLPGPTSPASPLKTLDTIINTATTSALYLGITVDDGNSSTVDAEISPRQQLVTGVYSMRALMAETVASGAITSTMLGANVVGTDQLAAGSINSAKLGTSAVEAGNILGGAITSAKIDTKTVGIWTPSGNNIYRNSNVGIGEPNPGVPLQFAPIRGDKISLHSGSATGTFYGFGIDGALLQIHTDTSASDIVFGYGSYAAMTETMRIEGTGNVGIGTTSPTEKLTVSGGALKVLHTSNPNVTVSNNSNQATLGVTTSAGQWSTSSSVNDVILKSDSSKVILQSGAGAAGIVIDTTNKVGIGTSSPTEKLSVKDGKLWFTTGTGGGDNGGIGGNIAGSDFFRIFGSSVDGVDNAGALYIDTYDNANEPISHKQSDGQIQPGLGVQRD